MRKRLAALVVVVMSISAAATAPANAAPIEIGHLPECLEVVPAAISPTPGSQTRLDVRVLLDGVSQARARQVIATAQRSYAPIGVTLAATYQGVSFSGTDAQGLIDQSKSVFGGNRPLGTDLVYTLTSKDMTDAGDSSVAGLADCIGGVAFPANAFAVGENFTPDEGSLLGLPGLTNRQLTAKVVSHELGHLLGAHHHYANCAEGLGDIATEGSPCTLMFNDVGLASLNFSTVNGLVVRGHGEAYAAP